MIFKFIKNLSLAKKIICFSQNYSFGSTSNRPDQTSPGPADAFGL
jgi:hypothetical protein